MEEKKTVPLMFVQVLQEKNTFQRSLDEGEPAVCVLPVRALLRSKTVNAQAKPKQPHRVRFGPSSTKMVKEAESDEQFNRPRFGESVLSELTPETLQGSVTQLKDLKEVVNLTFEKAMVRPNCSGLDANTNNMTEEEKKTMPFTYADIVREGKTLQSSLAANKPSVSVMPVTQKASSNLRGKRGLAQAKPEQPQRVTTVASSTQTVKEAESEEQLEHKTLSFVESVLSELTPGTLQGSITQLRTLHLSTEESLKEVVNLTFEKAMVRPDYSGLFAKICCCLSLVQVPSTANPTADVSFQTLLVEHCHAEFNSLFGSNDLNGKKETTRSRSVSTIQFIGELYKTHILSQAVMHSCIKGLINKQDAESLESLCELFKVIGRDLEVVTAMWVMNSYYKQMEVMAKEEKMSPRISLMLKSTIESRKKSFLGMKPSEVPQAKDEAPGFTASSKFTVDKKPQRELDKTAQEETTIQEKLDESESVVLVEPSSSVRKTQQGALSNLRKKTSGLTQTEPVVFVGAAFRKEWPKIYVRFGFSEDQV